LFSYAEIQGAKMEQRLTNASNKPRAAWKLWCSSLTPPGRWPEKFRSAICSRAPLRREIWKNKYNYFMEGEFGFKNHKVSIKPIL
jgi:hypothetical protein